MTNILVKFKDNWADEMDIEGFFITTREDWEKRVATLKDNFPYGLTYTIGTNEEIEYCSPDAILNHYKVIDLCADEYSCLTNLFKNNHGFGFAGPLAEIDDYVDALEEEEEKEDW